MAKSAQLLITCEHGGNKVPARYRQFFRGHEDLLKTHRGYDAGALVMAQDMATAFNAPLFSSTTSRMLIDLNRSIGHPHLYSEATRIAPAEVRREMLEQYYLPYRNQAEAAIAKMLAQGSRVIHVASHSFTPQLDGEVRNADIGLLYDPARCGEAELCGYWALTLKSQATGYKVRRNYPYTGRSDGFTAYLRRQFSADDYIGVELEINQKHVIAGGRGWRVLRGLVIDTLQQVLAGSEI
jgi:predicted N-formylglutamate amidohydrolase